MSLGRPATRLPGWRPRSAMAGFGPTSGGFRVRRTELVAQAGGGDNIDLEPAEGPTFGQLYDYRKGTASAPDTSNNPVAKISRTLAIPAANVHAIGDANASAFGVHAIGTAANQVQVTTLTAFARNVGTSGGTSKDGNATSPDAVALQAFARIQGGGVGASIPFVSIAHVDTATAKACNPVQLFVYNDSGSDSSVSTSAQTFARGISIYSYGANLGGCGIEIVGPVGNQGSQFDVGLHFAGAQAFNRVDANCGTTNNSATVTDASCIAADFNKTVAGAGIPANTVITSVTPGVSFTMSNKATATATVSLTISVQGPAKTAAIQDDSDALYGLYFTANCNHQTAAIAVANGGGSVLIGKTTAASTTPYLEVGTALTVSNTNTIGFFGATAVGQRSAVGTATGYGAGATAATFHSDDTYTGNTGTTAYTINGVVAALKNYGLLAA